MGFKNSQTLALGLGLCQLPLPPDLDSFQAEREGAVRCSAVLCCQRLAWSSAVLVRGLYGLYGRV